MDEDIKYLKYDEDKSSYGFVRNEDNADFAMIPLDQYKKLVKRRSVFDELANAKAATKREKPESKEPMMPEAPQGYEVIPTEELNGYKNLLRILNDRACQEVKKSQTDEYGYRILDVWQGEEILVRRSKKCTVDVSVPVKKIKMETPYSIKMNMAEADFIIEKNLQQYYAPILDINGYEFFVKLDEIFGKEYMEDFLLTDYLQGFALEFFSKSFSEMSLGVKANFLHGKYSGIIHQNKVEKNLDYSKTLDFANWLDSFGKTIIYNILDLHPNYGTGLWEVTVLATGFFEK